jgi:hypothetical protein
MPRCSKWSFALSASHQIPICNTSVPHTCYMPRLSHSSKFKHPNNIGWGVQLINP